MSIRPALLLAGLGLGGCLGGLGGDTLPPVRYYALSPPSEAKADGTAAIAVEELRTDAPYDDRRIVYRTGRYRLAYDQTDQWAAPPGVMVADYLRRAYQASGRFRLVLAESGADTAAILGGRVLAFEESVRGRTARIALDLELRDAETGRILWTRRAERQIPLSARSGEALAAALSRALASVAEETAAQVAAAAAE